MQSNVIIRKAKVLAVYDFRLKWALGLNGKQMKDMIHEVMELAKVDLMKLGTGLCIEVVDIIYYADNDIHRNTTK